MSSSADRLRADIGISDAGHDISGRPGLVLHDPLRHRFFWLPARLRGGLEVMQQGGLPGTDDGEGLANFLKQSQLIHRVSGASGELQAEWKRSQHSLASTVLHNYISFRLPLLKPEPFLDATLDIVRPLASRSAVALYAAAALLGFYLTLRQWDSFVAMLVSSFTLAGAFAVAATVLVLKVFHELGHAYVARHFGCRVPGMGVTFMLLTPMLYTDASDAWRFSSRWQRFLIGAAGVLVELVIAAFALLLWALLPDGSGRGIAFFVAVSALGASLLVNLSPFMRFDGYHMLADALGMHSLGPRSFALANWWLREALFKPDAPPPEFFPRGLRIGLVAFACATWIYRLMLFGGIALLLYMTLPKAAGVPLALVEVWFFIVKPVLAALRGWFASGAAVAWRSGRAKLTWGVVAFILLLAFLPLDRHVHVPAVLLAGNEAQIYAPEPAQVIRVEAVPGQKVKQGDVLARLMVPDIGHLQRQAQLRLDIVSDQLARIGADRRARAETLVLHRQAAAARSELDGLRLRGERLVLRAPFDGVVAADSLALREGQWVKANDMLFLVTVPNTARLLGLLPEREAARLSDGARLHFVAADGLMPPLEGQLLAIGLPGGEGRALDYLSSRFGGPVAVEQVAGHSHALVGHLPVLAAVEGAAPGVARSGTAVFEARPQSAAGFLLQRTVTVILRESGF